MTTAVRDLSITVRTPAGYQQMLSRLRKALERHGLEILHELPLDRELERKVGVRWQHHTLLVVWSPFSAYQAMLGDRDGALLVPFNISIAEDAGSTVIAVTNHAGMVRNGGPIGIQVLVRDLARKVRLVLMELAVQEDVPEYREVRGIELSNS